MRRPSRRRFLRGAGVSLALPFLPSAFPRSARAGGVAPPRLLFVYTPNGQPMAEWTPGGTGPDWAPSPVLEPLAALREQVTVITGLGNEPAHLASPNAHPSGTASFLTCQTPGYGAGGLLLDNGVSVDQVAANSLEAGSTPFPSIQALTRTLGPVGHCGLGIPCDYLNVISWADGQTPLPGVTDPRVLFDRLFASFDSAASAKEQDRRRALRVSVLDAVLDDGASLRGRLGAVDQRKLDQYLDGLRDLEVHIEALGTASCAPPDRPEAPEDPGPWIDAMSDLLAVALRCDLTRVATLMTDVGGSNRGFGFLGRPGGHHHYSHHGEEPDKVDALVDIGRWEVERLAYLLERLAAIDEGDGTTALDHTLVYFSSEVGDGDSHSHFDLPVVLAGGGALGSDPGRHLRFEDGAPLASLFVSMLRGFGLEVPAFGLDSDGPLPGLFG